MKPLPSHDNNLSANKVFLIGLLSYLTLTILAIVFFKERTIFIDAAFRFYEILKTGEYSIQANRFGSYFTQSFIYVSYLLGLPLKYLLINYSISFIIYKAIIFVACFKWLKNPPLAITLLLTDVLMVSETFYWIQNELIEGISFGIFYFAVLEFTTRTQRHLALHLLLMLLLLGMLFITIFFHPLMIIVVVFTAVFLILSTSDKRHKIYLGATIPIAFALVKLKSTCFESIYDETNSAFINNFKTFFPDYWSLPSNQRFLEYLVQDYYFLPFFFIALLIYYYKQKTVLKFLLLFIFCLGYLLLINVCYPNFSAQFHLEAFYMPLSYFLALAFTIDLLPLFSQKKALIFLTALIFCRLVHIGCQHPKYTARLDWERNLIKETALFGRRKLLVNYKDAPMETLMLAWGTAYEFWLLSTIEGDETRSILVYENKEPLMQYGNIFRKKTFLTNWGCYDYKDLPIKYFNFQDTTVYVEYIPKREKGVK